MTSNFDALAAALPEIAEIGRTAESVFSRDPHGAVAHLRRFGEALTDELLVHYRLERGESQHERLKKLQFAAHLDRGALKWFHELRQQGNRAVHGRSSLRHKDAMLALKVASRLAAWYWRTHTAQPPPPPAGFVRPRADDERTQLRLEAAEAAAERLAQEKAAAEARLREIEDQLEQPEVAVHIGFEPAYDALDEPGRMVASRFLKQFRHRPLSDDWPLASVPGARDDKARLATRDGLTYVVVQPPRGDVLLLVHVDADAERAAAWARPRRFEVNPQLGTVQVFDVEAAKATSQGMGGGLLAAHADETLLDVGVPRVLLPALRALASDDDLDEFCPLLPPEAADAVYLLAAGYTLDQVRVQLDQRVPDAVDASDFAAAVHHPDSQRSVVVLSGDEELDAVLGGSVAAWRLFLHPDQRRLVRMHARGPVRVLGGAGTGKTVALLHRAAYLLEDYFVDPSDRLLVTTFTRNLAADLRAQLGSLVTKDHLSRVEVVHLHGLIARLWKDHGDGRRIASDAQRARAWEIARSVDTLGLDAAFYETEWRDVVQAQDVTDEVGYLRVRRAGRKVALTRAKRREVWRVLAAYRQQLQGWGVFENEDRMRALREVLESADVPSPYQGVLVDETQDFGVAELRMLRALVEPDDNDLFLVGDAHQRIYGLPISMSACGIEIRGRGHRLRVNYRTTARVRNWATAALEGLDFDDLDGGADSLDGARSLRVGLPPTVRQFERRQDELAFVHDQVRAWLEAGPAEAVGIGCPSSKTADEVREHLEDQGVPTVVLQTDASEVGDGVRIGTFHRLKGLEFPRVLLTSVQQGLMPVRNRAYFALSDAEKALWDRKQRCLLYVAATRARDELVVSGTGDRSEFVRVGES